MTKHWKGDEGKITHEELSYIVGPLPKRTNQDQRDATILAWWYADLPIKNKDLVIWRRRKTSKKKVKCGDCANGHPHKGAMRFGASYMTLDG